MTNQSISDAADLLWNTWQREDLLDAIPPEIRPATRAEGYAIQEHLERRSASPRFGWKIAATSQAGQAHINVDGPLAGRLLSERVVPDGGRVPFGRNHMRVAEAEFAFRFGVDVPPRDTPYSTADVLDAVATLHPAIEIPDSRYADFTTVGAAQLIADNACAHYFVLGPASEAPWRAFDLAAHHAVGSIRRADGRSLDRQGIGANVLGDPRDALAWLVNELSALGLTIHAGEAVTTGTCLVPLAIEGGDVVEADFGALGRVRAQIEYAM
ncbi:MAG TPA: fumarylacetoacetate hydrolase family protein [Vicinamibacterales bacterium]|jgi:2-keto-4-pentenoate hydratase|nr:fumarylacetoacetate hydrolase family protein [Vicinamibacterales bacterium]